MTSLHELLGQEVERRAAAEVKAQANFGAMRSLCAAVLRCQAGTLDVNDIQVVLTETTCQFEIATVTKVPPAPPPVPAEDNVL